MKLNGKRVDLPLLKTEATTAGVVVGDLGTVGLDPSGLPDELITWDSEGVQTDVPPTMQPVVAAHTAPPLVVEYVETRSVAAVTRTTDGAFHEIWRLATAPKHVYRATLEMQATDAGDGTTKAQQAVLVFKGTAASVVQVGATAALWVAQDAAAAAWTIQAQVQSADLVFGVRGASGKTIDWSLDGQVVVFAPGGLGGGS